MTTSVITEKGQTTIPVLIRKFLGLNSGSKVAYATLPDGSVLMKPLLDDLESLKGFLTATQPVTLEKMENAIHARRKARQA